MSLPVALLEALLLGPCVSVSADFSRSAVLIVAAEGGPLEQLGVIEGAVSLITRTDRVLFTKGTPRANRLYEGDPAGTWSRPLSDSTVSLGHMVYSADASRIAFVRTAPPLRQLWEARADGSGARMVADVPPGEGRLERPTWSPDGSRLAFHVGMIDSGTRQMRGAHIWIVDVATGVTTKLASHESSYNDTAPAWFPDGRRIAFASDRTGAREIWVMDADGKKPRQVTR